MGIHGPRQIVLLGNRGIRLDVFGRSRANHTSESEIGAFVVPSRWRILSKRENFWEFLGLRGCVLIVTLSGIFVMLAVDMWYLGGDDLGFLVDKTAMKLARIDSVATKWCCFP